MYHKLPYPEIQAQLRDLLGWTYWKGGLTRTYEFEDFAKVSRFVVKIRAFCVTLDHYPEILIQPNKNGQGVTVKVTTTTHAVGGEVTNLDLQVGQALNNAAASADYELDNSLI